MLSNGHFVESWDKDEKDIADACQAQKSETTDSAADDVVIGITKNRFPILTGTGSGLLPVPSTKIDEAARRA